MRERTQRLLQCEKLSAMGQLLAGVAHELNNPLSVVMGQAPLLQHWVAGRVADRALEKIAGPQSAACASCGTFSRWPASGRRCGGASTLNAVVGRGVELVGYELRAAPWRCACSSPPTCRCCGRMRISSTRSW